MLEAVCHYYRNSRFASTPGLLQTLLNAMSQECTSKSKHFESYILAP